jgi:hypothetical protein
MRCRSTHKAYEVVIALAAHCVDAQVPDGLRVGLSGRVEAETDLYVLIFQVSVDSFGTSDDLALGLMLLKILCEQARISI